jgi:hypothetical protein
MIKIEDHCRRYETGSLPKTHSNNIKLRKKDKIFCKFSVSLNFVIIIIKMNYDVGANRAIIRAFARVQHVPL